MSQAYSAIRSFILVGLISSSTLTACASKLDVAQVEDTIAKSVQQEGGIQVKQVDCPADVPKAVGLSFACAGEIDPKGQFLVIVQQKDTEGNVQWQIPHTADVLNLTKLEEVFQQAIQAKTKVSPTIDCGTAYRTTRPGDTFTCTMTAKGKSDTIQVTVDGKGDVQWRQVQVMQVATGRPDASTAVAPELAITPTAPPASPASVAVKAADIDIPNSQAAAATSGSADDFLNQPGALDGFD